MRRFLLIAYRLHSLLFHVAYNFHPRSSRQDISRVRKMFASMGHRRWLEKQTLIRDVQQQHLRLMSKLDQITLLRDLKFILLTCAALIIIIFSLQLLLNVFSVPLEWSTD